MNSIKPVNQTLARRLKQRRVRIAETLKMLSMAQSQAEKKAIVDYLNSI
jgi:hypothetical protein